ncbi:hypothetical protein U1Q18_041896 [Sarracenia purpurea var. burkii]
MVGGQEEVTIKGPVPGMPLSDSRSPVKQEENSEVAVGKVLDIIKNTTGPPDSVLLPTENCSLSEDLGAASENRREQRRPFSAEVSLSKEEMETENVRASVADVAKDVQFAGTSAALSVPLLQVFLDPKKENSKRLAHINQPVFGYGAGELALSLEVVVSLVWSGFASGALPPSCGLLASLFRFLQDMGKMLISRCRIQWPVSSVSSTFAVHFGGDLVLGVLKV